MSTQKELRAAPARGCFACRLLEAGSTGDGVLVWSGSTTWPGTAQAGVSGLGKGARGNADALAEACVCCSILLGSNHCCLPPPLSAVHRSRAAVHLGELQPGSEQAQKPLRKRDRLRPLARHPAAHRRYRSSVCSSLVARLKFLPRNIYMLSSLPCSPLFIFFP